MQKTRNHLLIAKTIFLWSIISLFKLLIVISIFTSCKKSTNDHNSFVLIGEVKSDDITTIYLLENNGIAGDELIDSTVVENNQFVFDRTNIDEGYYVIVSSLSKKIRPQLLSQLYLDPNDTLKISFNHDKNQYFGKNAHIQEYLNYSYEVLKKDSIYANIYQNLYAFALLDLKEASSLIDSMRSKEIRIFDKFMSNKEIPEKFKTITLAKIKFRAASQHYKYLQYHKGISEDQWEYLAADSSFYNFLAKIDLNSDYNHQIYPYKTFLEYHLNDVFIRANQLYSDTSKKNYLSKSSVSKLIFKTEWIKNNLTGLNQDIAISNLYEMDSDYSIRDSSELFYRDLELIHSYFANNYSSSEIFNKSDAIYHEYLKIKPGSTAPPLKLPDSSGVLVGLDDFVGKVIYIDFWGTWCGPCIASIPNYRKLQQKFAGQDVVFLNVALEAGEKEIDAWKKFLKENDFPGIHVVAEKQFHNEYIRSYRIRSAPTYILIDKEGKISSANAPSPDNAEEDIKALLN